MTDERPWFEEAFGAGYLDLYAHRDVGSARREVAGLVERGLGAGGGALLDLCCGFGRHTLAMREAGLEAFGMDLSEALLERGVGLGADAVLAGRLVRGDVRTLPFRRASFSALTMLFSSFGYFDDATNAAVLREVARVLRPGGVLVLDLMNAARIRAGLVPESRTERDGAVWIEERSLSPDGRRVRKSVRVEEPGGSVRSWREDVRLFDPEEVDEMLGGAGFGVERLEGDFDGSGFGPATPRCLVWARRGAS